MKKFTVLLATIALTTSFAHAMKIHISRTGSTDGVNYDRVVEDHTWTLFGGNHSLGCHDPGAVFCGWSNPPGIIGGYNSQDIEKFVAVSIANGVYYNTTLYNGRVQVSWKFDPDTKDLTIDMTDEI